MHREAIHMRMLKAALALGVGMLKRGSLVFEAAILATHDTTQVLEPVTATLNNSRGITTGAREKKLLLPRVREFWRVALVFEASVLAAHIAAVFIAVKLLVVK